MHLVRQKVNEYQQLGMDLHCFINKLSGGHSDFGISILMIKGTVILKQSCAHMTSSGNPQGFMDLSLWGCSSMGTC